MQKLSWKKLLWAKQDALRLAQAERQLEHNEFMRERDASEARGRSLMAAINRLHEQWRSDGRPHRFDPI